MRGIAWRLNRSAAPAQAAAPRQSSQRSAKAKRPKPAWTALRRHSAGVNRPPESVAGRRGCRSGLRRFLGVAVVPGDVALQPVLDVARLAYSVVLPRIDDQLRRHSHAPERLIHLLRAHDRHVEVRLAAEEERRCRDAIRLEEREGHAKPGVEVLPRWPQLLLVFANVLIAAVAGEGVGG